MRQLVARQLVGHTTICPQLQGRTVQFNRILPHVMVYGTDNQSMSALRIVQSRHLIGTKHGGVWQLMRRETHPGIVVERHKQRPLMLSEERCIGMLHHDRRNIVRTNTFVGRHADIRQNKIFIDIEVLSQRGKKLAGICDSPKLSLSELIHDVLDRERRFLIRLCADDRFVLKAVLSSHVRGNFFLSALNVNTILV